MLKITKSIDLKDFSGLRVGSGVAQNSYEIENLQDFKELLGLIDLGKFQRLIVVGEGSNTVFVNEKTLNLLRINIHEIKSDDGALKVGAGVNWDVLVQKYIELGGVGMESLSAIPGTVGAAPVQNIGAYGKEVSEFIESIEVYDRLENKFKTLQNSECEFKYRDSMFKHAGSRYIILFVNFRILCGEPEIPDQTDIKNYLANKKNITNASDLWKDPGHINTTQAATVQEIREAVVEVRKLKMPDPRVVPNCGSFFKNPIINRVELRKVQEKFPGIPMFPASGMRSGVSVDDEFVKIPIAYVIDKIGLKGYNADFRNVNFGIHKEHALILISNGHGSVPEFKEFINFVKQKMEEACGIRVEEEVNLI